MTGSLLVTYNNDDGLGGDYLQISKNGTVRKRIYTNSNNLYSIPVVVGDVITVEYFDVPPSSSIDLTITRKDYTNDDEGGDKGIKETLVDSIPSVISYSFTATTINGSYDFQYLLKDNVITNYQLWTEASEPIMTENNDYINQQF